MSTQSQYEQGQLLVIAEQSGQMYVPDSAETPDGLNNYPAVSTIEHYIHLQNVITHFAGVSMLNGYMENDDLAIRHGLDQAPRAQRQAIEGQVAFQAQSAKLEFIRATGNEALVGADMISEQELKRLNNGMFSDFMKKYYGHRNYQEAQAFRNQLIDHTRALQSHHTELNRSLGLRPHANKAATEKSAPEIKGMNTAERLRAIVTDPRALFMPPTNREKNQVLSFLDYLDNPEYPFGVNNQFLEVFTHSQKIRRKNQSVDSERGPVSIAYEFGDYLANAIAQRQALQELESQLVTLPNLRVLLGEERDWIDIKHPGFAALIRYRDLSTLMKQGSVDGIADPLLTQEHRWTHQGPGRHKIVEDRYTGGQKKQEFEDYITEATLATTVGEARELVGPAITDQLMREAFMQQRLEEIATPPVIMIGKAREVLTAASNAAQEVLEQLAAA